MSNATLRPRHLQPVTGPTPYTEFTPEVEAAIVYHATSDDEFWLSIGQHVDTDALRSEPAKMLMQSARQLATAGAPLSHTIALGKLQERVHNRTIDQSDLDEVDEWITQVEDAERGLPPKAAVVQLAAPVLRQRQRAAIIQELAARNAVGKDIGDLPLLLASTEDIGRPQARDFATLGDGVWAMFQRLRRAERLKLGIPDLDEAMGGMPRGSLLTIGGDPGDGKSLMLVDVVCHALLTGRRCLYVTLEMGVAQTLMRFVANLTCETEESVGRGDKAVRDKYSSLLSSGLVAPFAICYLPQGSTIPMVDKAIKNVQSRDPRFANGWDLLAVDYGDLMAGNPSDRNTYEEMKTVWKGLRAFAANNTNWTITASQLRDKDQRDGTVYDYADSKHKGRITDSGLIISKDPDVESERRVRVAKHRDGRAGDTIGPFLPDFARAQFHPRIEEW